MAYTRYNKNIFYYFFWFQDPKAAHSCNTQLNTTVPILAVFFFWWGPEASLQALQGEASTGLLCLAAPAKRPWMEPMRWRCW